MKNYAIYRIATGELTQTGMCPDFLLTAQEPVDTEFGLIEIPQLSWNYYVDDGELKEKVAHNYSINKSTLLANDTDEIIITGLHNPTQVITNPGGFVDEVTDGEFRLSTDQAGQYTLTLKAIPYLNEEITIEAIATP